MSLTSISSASRYYARPRHGSPTMGFADLFSPMVAGLALRVVVDVVTFHDVRLSGTLVGLFEGVVLLYYVKNRKTSEPAYAAYAIRVLVDFWVTESIFRLVVVLLWTTMGMVLADVAPAVWTETGLKRQWSRFRRDLSRSARILLTRGPTAMAEETTTSADPAPTAPFVRTRPVKRPVPGTFPGAEWSETETARSGTVITEEDEEEYDDEIYEDDEEEEEPDEEDEEVDEEDEASEGTGMSFYPVPTIGPQASEPSELEDSNTFSLTTPPQSPPPT
ncbi:hypothetical protein MVEN_00819700 [Mycena venus]|uniref:Uncharacterized protein n=1 Tax=Mycena venus TaxID=2733690 RepID=A0A8H6YB23_9AGAR|nr:hypothetical protein MVEN_00819700 [Mycena venus]